MKNFNQVHITNIPLPSNASLSIIPVGNNKFTLGIRDDEGSYRELDSALGQYDLQEVSDIGNITDNNIIIRGITYSSTISKKITSQTNRTFDNGELNELVVTGYNIFNKLEGKTEMGQSGVWSKRYVGYGTDVFPDFEGNTDYRPNHPAHDSIIGFGSMLGYGVKDGTNFTLMGTGVFNSNDIPVWDSVTSVGKGIYNAKQKYSNPNRIAISSNGFNLRERMDNVVLYGNEIWAGDWHSCTIIGFNNRNYKYGFNSVVVGGNNLDLSSVKYPDEDLDVILDNDVIIGNGIYKDPKIYPLSHNLIIGSQLNYGIGSPDLNYIPLIVGNFKDKFFGVNGKSINRYTKEYHKVPTEEVTLNLISSPTNSNASYNSTTKTLSLNNSPSGTYRLFDNLIPGQAYLFTIYSNIDPTGTWGYNVSANIDLGNGDGWLGTKNQFVSVVTGSTNFDITLSTTTGVTGTIHVELNHVINGEEQDAIYEIQDLNNDVVFEVRTGNASDSHLSLGKNSASKYASGTMTNIIGSDTLVEANSINSSNIIGNNNLKNVKSTRLNQLIGNNILTNTVNADRIVAVGDGISSQSIGSLRDSILFGDNAVSSFIGSMTSDRNEIISIGVTSGFQLEECTGSIFLGTGTGWCKNVTNSTLLGNRSKTKDSLTSNNEIVVGANAIGNGDNTATIGNADIEALYIGGQGAGIILTSPDGTKKVKISVDNSGNLITSII